MGNSKFAGVIGIVVLIIITFTMLPSYLANITQGYNVAFASFFIIVLFVMAIYGFYKKWFKSEE